MVCKNTWLEDKKGLHKEFTGDVSLADVLLENNHLYQDSKFDDISYIIYDFSTMTNPTFAVNETETIAKVARIRSNTKDGLKVALISRDAPESKAAAKGFCKQMIDCHYLCEVFHDLADAQDWALAS